jgi:hypothetical protein
MKSGCSYRDAASEHRWIVRHLGPGFYIDYGTKVQIWDSLTGLSGTPIQANAYVILAGTSTNDLDPSDVTFSKNPRSDATIGATAPLPISPPESQNLVRFRC